MLMRFVAAAAAFAALLTAFPAAAQKGPKPEPTILSGVTVAPETPTAAPLPTDKENLWLLDLSSGGRVTILLRPDHAPKMVAQIKTLTRKHFYDGTIFHRVNDAPESMAQGGDPKGNGTGGSDLPNVPAEFNRLPHMRGAVSAARPGAPDGATQEQKDAAINGANSQFFIMFAPRLGFDENYTVFGRVIAGMPFVDSIQRGEPPSNPTKIIHAYIASDNPPEYQAEAVKRELPPGEVEVMLPGTAPAKTPPPATGKTPPKK
jgi:cyclophilin family peptidyl-prolyl cis-trans isomerase